MGNRGTTRSWDEEQIAVFGLVGHYAYIARSLKAPQRKEKSQRETELLKLFALLRTILQIKEEEQFQKGLI